MCLYPKCSHWNGQFKFRISLQHFGLPSCSHADLSPTMGAPGRQGLCSRIDFPPRRGVPPILHSPTKSKSKYPSPPPPPPLLPNLNPFLPPSLPCAAAPAPTGPCRWASRGVVEGYDCSGRNKCQRHLYQLDGCNVYFWFMNWIMIGIVVGLCYCCCCLACARGKEKQRQAAAKHRQEATALDLVDDTGDPYAPPHADAYAPYGDPIGEPIHLNTPQSDNSAAGPETVASVPSKSRA